MSPYSGELFGMCDDLAIATTNVRETLQILLKIFQLVTRFASLKLNQPKSQITFACQEDRDRGYDDMLCNGSGLTSDSFQDYLKYLGIHIGPGADAVQWRSIATSYSEAVHFIKGLHCGLIPSIVL